MLANILFELVGSFFLNKEYSSVDMGTIRLILIQFVLIQLCLFHSIDGRFNIHGKSKHLDRHLSPVILSKQFDSINLKWIVFNNNNIFTVNAK